jgi:hypothetical protein
MFKKLSVVLAGLLFSAQALASYSQPIFQVRGTQVKPYHSRGLSSYTTLKTQAGSADAAVLSLGTSGVYGSSVLNMTATRSYLVYDAHSNWTNTGPFTVQMRIVPLWTGAPAARQNLIFIGDADNSSCTLILSIAVTTGKMSLELDDARGNSVSFATTVNALSFTNGVPTSIGVTWDGTKTSNNIKVYQDHALLESITPGSSPTGTWSNAGTPMIRFGWDYSGANTVNYYLNEVDIWDDVEDLSQAQSDFITSTNFNGDTYTDPGAANVLASVGSYFFAGNSITPTYSPALPNASDLRSGVVVSSVTGTLAVPSPTQVLSGVATDNTVGAYITAATSAVKIGQTFGPSGSLTGTYDGSDRWTDPGLANVMSGVQYKANSLTLNETGTLLSVDPGIGNVLSGVNYSINSVGKTGTFSTSCTDPGFHNVKHGTTYVFNSTLLTGDYRGADLWSDPIFNNVSNGVTYLADGVSMTGNLNSVNNVMAMGTLVAQVPGASKPQANSLTVTQGDDVAFNFVALTGPSNTPMSLSGATLTSYIEGVTYDNLHHAIANQGTNPGQFSLFLSASETAALKTGSNLEVITKVVQGGKTFYLHGVGVLRVLSPKPGLNYTSLDAGRARHRTVAHLGAVKHAA